METPTKITNVLFKSTPTKSNGCLKLNNLKIRAAIGITDILKFSAFGQPKLKFRKTRKGYKSDRKVLPPRYSRHLRIITEIL